MAKTRTLQMTFPEYCDLRMAAMKNRISGDFHRESSTGVVTFKVDNVRRLANEMQEVFNRDFSVALDVDRDINRKVPKRRRRKDNGISFPNLIVVKEGVVPCSNNICA